MGPVGFQSWLVVVVLVLSAGPVVEAYRKCALNGDTHLRGFPNDVNEGNKGDIPYPCNYLAVKSARFNIDGNGNSFQICVETSNDIGTVKGRFVPESVKVTLCKFNNVGQQQKKFYQSSQADMEANLATAVIPWTTTMSLGNPFNSYIKEDYDNSTGTATIVVEDSTGNVMATIEFFPRLSPAGFQDNRGLHINLSTNALPSDAEAKFPISLCSVAGDNIWGSTSDLFNTTAKTIVYALLGQSSAQSRSECIVYKQIFSARCQDPTTRNAYFEQCSVFFNDRKVMKCVNENAGAAGAGFEAFALCLFNKCAPQFMSADQNATYTTTLGYCCTATP